MKKFLKIVAVLMLIIAAIGGYVYYKMSSVEKETVDLAKGVIVLFSDNWDPVVFQKASHPLLLKNMAEARQNWDEYTQVYRKLGKLRKPPECLFQGFRSNIDSTGHYTVANYACRADYDNGPATVLMQLRQESDDNAWLISGLQIDSPLFLKLLGK